MSQTREHPLAYSVHSRLRKYYLEKAFFAAPGGRLLDVGSGLGYLTEVCRPLFDTYGVERDMQSVRQSRKRAAGRLVQSDASRLPFKNAAFDRAVCSEVLEHLPDGLDRQTLIEIARVMKEGGRIFITVPAKEGIRSGSKLRNLGHDDPAGGEYHYRIGYTADEIRSMVSGVPGLRVVSCRYSMVLCAELFMDLLKWSYAKKYSMKEHSDIMKIKNTFSFNVYKIVFPFLLGLFLFEDWLCSRFLKGHILIVVLEKHAQ